MLYKLKQQIPKNYLYHVKGDLNIFLNSLFFIVNSNKKYNLKPGSRQSKKIDALKQELKDFLDYCDTNEISPENFVRKSPQYKLTTVQPNSVERDVNQFGLQWKHLVTENLDELEYLDIYNFRIDGNKIKYDYQYTDFLKCTEPFNLDDYFHNEKTFYLDRKNTMLFTDYLKMGFYDFEIGIEISHQQGINHVTITTDNQMSNAVYCDFVFFYERNTVECVKCKKLVRNAFDEYMIQFYKHDGC